MSQKKPEPKTPPRTMQIVRSWLPAGQFQYFAVYSDGEMRPSSKKEALQWSQAYKKSIQTIIGVPSAENTNSI
jgi:hypothetical protein